MHVGLITYQVGHRKTLELLLKCLTNGYRITVFAFPFKLRPDTRLGFQDRPYQIIDFDMPGFCCRHSIGYLEVDGWGNQHAKRLGVPSEPNTPDVFFTAIAKIIPAGFIDGRTILNCHPGLLPENRGVDAFKWSIINKWPIGITLHAIDPEIDRGIILYRMRVPIFPTDVLQYVCLRAYAMEVDLLSNFQTHLDNMRYNWTVSNNSPLSKRRIDYEDDSKIETIFKDNVETFVDLSVQPTSQPKDYAA